MKITLSWHEPIELGSSSTLREKIKNFNLKDIPEISGIYIFYREYGEQQKALYVGKSENIRTRIKSHFNSLSLIEGLEESQQGKKKLIFAEVKTRSDIGRALNQAEKGFIQHYIENKHPLLNKKLMDDHFDEIVSTGHTIDLVSEDIWVYSTKTIK
ncbi:DNA polymerase-3 subunit epsilon [Acinetobacter marinus]|uniref:DNA polymerase-3 subunit epsilon n=1 Tax=Acinetobacter marinus TaxID=281375 RepID=A0A1G6NFI2_9GAMM|nr:GIY-YIG nuclease family protein [Acinetobacter marinus]SDC66076.1 DNA polymerase-3 subunit epsilon [Acinetobacter marinus]